MGGAGTHTDRRAASGRAGAPTGGRGARGAAPGRSAPVGLERHPSLDERFDPAIRIVAHDPSWAGQAQEELRRIGEALGSVAVRLEHIGSTAVPGLAAKPVIDLMVSVAAVEPRETYVPPLEQLGYLFVPDPETPDLHFFGRPPERPRSHHLHVCEVGSAHESRHLALRDYLCGHADEAARYAALKRELVERAPQDRLAYIEGKDEYLRELEARAVRWARQESFSRPSPRSSGGTSS